MSHIWVGKTLEEQAIWGHGAFCTGSEWVGARHAEPGTSTEHPVSGCRATFAECESLVELHIGYIGGLNPGVCCQADIESCVGVYTI